MRDTKSLLLLLVSLLLVLVSFVLIWTWGYKFYSKAEDSAGTPKMPVVVVPASSLGDSLQKIYSADLLNLDKQLDSTLNYSDSLNILLDIKLAEFYRLRNEIADILKNRDSRNNYSQAKQKLTELQTKVDNLKEKNLTVDNENKKLNDVLNEIRKTDSRIDKNMPETPKPKTASPENPNPVYQLFTVSDIELTAISGGGDTETSEAERANRFKGYFSVVNFNSQLTNAEMYVVLLRPDGRVLKNSGWESGSFNTSEGKKVYSYKFSFSYTRGEIKRLNFSMSAGNLVKGNYSMEIYYNGQLIGKTVRSLS
ncbi:MAG: hypothetical protein IPL84_00880 [Chitinophagaceae bacterium]|nr:hypothetical protein [Chitinophagaceae bacterium]